MSSLYIHIPFCEYKCEYCSFHVLETHNMTDPDSIKRQYINALKKEIDEKVSTISSLYTVYIGWGTPTSLGANGLIELIEHLGQHHPLEDIAELTIECNPDSDDIIHLIRKVSKLCKKMPRIRRNIGIQSFDNDILRDARRQYTFNSLVGFLRDLQKIKQPNMCYNLDFIAFGKLKTLKNGNIQLRDQSRMDFFEAIVESSVFDGFSLYTLELFPGSARYEQKKHQTNHEDAGYAMKQYGDDDAVYTEFSILKDVLLSHGYQRYELSNFAKVSKQSIHNHIYRSMDEYVGVGTSASGLIYQDNKRLRVTNTRKLTDYLNGKWQDDTQTIELNEKDRLIEGFFLALRTSHSIEHIDPYRSVLVDDLDEKIADLIDQGMMIAHEKTIRLTDEGMDVYNSIVTMLLEEV